MAGKAFARLEEFTSAVDGTVSQMRIGLDIAAGDGVLSPKFFSGVFTFDASLTPAQNLAALKNAVVAQCGVNGISLTAADVSVFTAIN